MIARIADMGHEIGYHYETLTKARGNVQAAIDMFADELRRMRGVAPVRTVSMHGSPLSPWDNLELIAQIDLAEHDLLGDASLNIDWAEAVYLTDTGRSWDQDNNVRDRMASRQQLPPSVVTTDDLIQFISEEDERHIIISAHPNRWTSGHCSWLVSAATDRLANHAKRVARYCHAN